MPKQSGPQLENVHLVSHWEKYGDVSENKISAIGAGAYANVGLTYTLPIHEGKSEELVQATIYHDNISVDSRKNADTKLSGGNMSEDSWERWFSFDTKGWETGEYLIEAIVRDEISGRNSPANKFTFEVVDPLRPSDVELTRIEKPPTIKKGQKTTFTLHLKNVSEMDNSIVSTISVRYDGSDWQSADEEERFKLNIPAGETRKWESGEVSFDYTGTYEYRLDDVDTVWSFSVTE